MPRRKVIVDTDLGYVNDDAITVMLALASPELEVLAVTLVEGNFPLAVEVASAHKVAHKIGLEKLPIYGGADRPLLRRPGPYEAGLWGGWATPDATAPIAPEFQGPHAADVMIDLVRENPGEVSILALGPLTNVAIALAKAPDIADKVDEMLISGGAFCNFPLGGGIQTPSGDFNIWVDPEAARMVLEAGFRTTLFPLNITRQIPWPDDLVPSVVDAANEFSELFKETLQPLDELPKLHVDRADLLDIYGITDEVVVLAAIDKTIFQTRAMYVEVETSKSMAYGTTYAYELMTDRLAIAGDDPLRETGVYQPMAPTWTTLPPHTVDVAIGVDVDRTLREIIGRLSNGLAVDV